MCFQAYKEKLYPDSAIIGIVGFGVAALWYLGMMGINKWITPPSTKYLLLAEEKDKPEKMIFHSIIKSIKIAHDQNNATANRLCRKIDIGIYLIASTVIIIFYRLVILNLSQFFLLYF